MTDIDHVPASHFGFYLGIDYDGIATYPALDAVYQEWNIALGKGAYGDT